MTIFPYFWSGRTAKLELQTHEDHSIYRICFAGLPNLYREDYTTVSVQV